MGTFFEDALSPCASLCCALSQTGTNVKIEEVFTVIYKNTHVGFTLMSKPATQHLYYTDNFGFCLKHDGGCGERAPVDLVLAGGGPHAVDDAVRSLADRSHMRCDVYLCCICVCACAR